MNELAKLGWTEFFEAQLQPNEKQTSTVARIIEPLRGLSRAIYTEGELWAESTEKSSGSGKSRLIVPAVGDWVVGTLREFGGGEKRLSIDRILERKNKLSRQAPGGKNYEQILCTNVDVAFLVIALTQELNLRSIERYLQILSENLVLPVVILSKVDSTSDAREVIGQIQAVAPGVALHPIGVKEERGLAPLSNYFAGSKTIVLLGASGAGKSTLVNYFMGEKSQRVEEVRESDQKGRHTTTGRRLVLLASGGMVIDSPGIREVQRWQEPEPQVEEEIKKKPKSFKSRARRSLEEDDEE